MTAKPYDDVLRTGVGWRRRPDTPEDQHTMHDTQPYRARRQAQARRPRRAAPRERRPVNWRRRIGLTFVVLLAAAIVGVVLLWQRAAAFNDAVSTQSALSMRLFGPFSPERVNVLMLGYSDESRAGAFLTDSMNVISVDKASDTTTIIPIPRDLWIEGLPEVPQNLKMNEAFRIGYYADGLENAADLAVEAVAYATGLQIDGWITLDFQGFQAMVDGIGGITIDNPTAFAYTWDEPEYLAGDFQFSFAAGTLELDGQQALDYARNRYTSVPAESSDFARSVRQQRVLSAIKAKVSGWEAVSQGLALADALKGHLHTNLPVLDLGMLAGHMTPDRRIELGEDQILEATTNTIGQYVLVVIGRSGPTDYEPLHEFVADALGAPATAEPAPSQSLP
jgi:polyisoprenyl-teichoic acid--peptidoglycan teichoic acid transferase